MPHLLVLWHVPGSLEHGLLTWMLRSSRSASHLHSSRSAGFSVEAQRLVRAGSHKQLIPMVHVSTTHDSQIQSRSDHTWHSRPCEATSQPTSTSRSPSGSQRTLASQVTRSWLYRRKPYSAVSNLSSKSCLCSQTNPLSKYSPLQFQLKLIIQLAWPVKFATCSPDVVS
jgi:hypothetical protein